MIYFDHNATTPIDERVLEAMRPYQTHCFGNPSSLYRVGRISRDAVENARIQVAALVGAHPSEVVFTSSGTEANNLALKGMAAGLDPGRIACGATEHPSVYKVLDVMSENSWDIRTIPVLYNGALDTSAIRELINDRTLRMVALMLANNETGVVHDLSGAIKQFGNANVVVHCDAVQAAGKIVIDFERIGAHSLSLSAHKIYGPKGAGALVVKKSVQLSSLIHGGEQEQGRRAGTENVAAIVGFGKAAEIALAELEERQKALLALRSKLEDGLEQIPGLTIFGKKAERLSNTVQFGVAGLDGEMLLMELDRRGIAVSSGSACSTSSGGPSRVLLAMGVGESLVRSAVRLSLGKDNSEQDIERFLSSFADIVDRLMPEAVNG